MPARSATGAALSVGAKCDACHGQHARRAVEQVASVWAKSGYRSRRAVMEKDRSWCATMSDAMHVLGEGVSRSNCVRRATAVRYVRTAVVLAGARRTRLGARGQSVCRLANIGCTGRHSFTAYSLCWILLTVVQRTRCADNYRCVSRGTCVAFETRPILRTVVLYWIHWTPVRSQCRTATFSRQSTVSRERRDERLKKPAETRLAPVRPDET